MPRPDTPPVPTYLALPMASGDAYLVAAFPNGKLAIALTISNRLDPTWVALTPPDPSLLWPAPAPEAPIADQAEVRYGALDWQPGLWRCGCGFLLATTKKSCTTCGEVSPALRPEPTP